MAEQKPEYVQSDLQSVWEIFKLKYNFNFIFLKLCFICVYNTYISR